MEVTFPDGTGRWILSWSESDIRSTCAPLEDEVLAAYPVNFVGDEFISLDHDPLPAGRVYDVDAESESNPGKFASYWPLETQSCAQCCIDKARTSPPHERKGRCSADEESLTSNFCEREPKRFCCAEDGGHGIAVVRYLDCAATDRIYDVRACEGATTSSCAVDRSCTPVEMSALIRYGAYTGGFTRDREVWGVYERFSYGHATGLSYSSPSKRWGNRHECSITGGVLRCSGVNANGQLGLGQQVMGDNASGIVSPDTEWIDVDASNDTTCAVTASGEVYCWGRNDFHQVGVGAERQVWLPVKVLDGPIARVIVDYELACAIETSGVAHCWGFGLDGLLRSLGPTLPVILPGTWRELSFTPVTMCGVRTDGAGLCWGRGATMLPVQGTSDAPMVLDGSWRSIAAGDEMSCGITEAGVLKCWGPSTLGACDYVRRAVSPITIGEPSNEPWQEVVSGGFRRVCATDATKTMLCWGEAPDGAQRNRPEVACIRPQ